MSVRARRRAVSEADKYVRREEILGAAKVVFAKNGFHETAIADVANEAKLSYGSVYWYFDSKEALYHAVVEGEERALWDHLGAAVASDARDEDPARTLVRGVQAAFEYFAADPAAASLLSFDRFADDLERLIVDAQRRGAIVDAPARILALVIAGVISSIAGRVFAEPGFAPAATAEVIVSLLLNGLLPR